MSDRPVTWSGKLRDMAMADVPVEISMSRRSVLSDAADEIDRKTDALIDLLKLFMEIDGGEHARHPAVAGARQALGNATTGGTNGTSETTARG